MSVKPLLEKLKVYEDTAYNIVEEHIINEIKSDVLECLKKYKKGELTTASFICDRCHKQNYTNYLLIKENKVFCKDCWFKECFGEVEQK